MTDLSTRREGFVGASRTVAGLRQVQRQVQRIVFGVDSSSNCLDRHSLSVQEGDPERTIQRKALRPKDGASLKRSLERSVRLRDICAIFNSRNSMKRRGGREARCRRRKYHYLDDALSPGG